MDEEHRKMHRPLCMELPEIRGMEVDMFSDLSDKLYPKHPKWSKFCAYLDAYAPVPHDAMEKGLFEVGKELRAKGHIKKAGCYDKLKACLKDMEELRSIVEICENKIKNKWKEHRPNFGDHSGQTPQTTSSEEERKGNITVNVYSRSLSVQEGQMTALRCSVRPLPSSITWMKGSPEPEEEIFIDNMKYIAGNPQSPPLVISNTDKSSDESYYCLIATGNDKRTTKKSESIYLRVDKIMQDRSPVSSTQNTTDRNASAHFRKRTKSEATTDIESESDEPQTRRPRTDNDANVTFRIENDIDTSRQKSKEDICIRMEIHIQERGRITRLEFVKQFFVLVTFDIKGAASPTEPSALCLAEQIKSFLRTGEIRLSDDANTILKIKTDDIRLTIKNRTLEGCPIVSVSQAEYHADEGTLVVMHCSVLAYSPAISVRWVRIRYGEEEELDIDNDKYLGGNVLSPSLVITDVCYTDEGYYKCYVKSSDGEGESDTAWLETNSDHTDLSSFLHHNGYDKVDSSALTLIKTYLASNRTSGDDVPLLKIAIDNDSIDLLRYIISTEPEVLSSFNVDGCDALHYCCQYGTLPLFKLLIESGMKAEGTTANGSTCLMMATLNRSRQILQYVIENFPKQLHIVNSDGTNCLLMSCVRNNIHIFELLLKTGISHKHRDKSGNTCLMTAIKYGNNCLARYIVENYTKQLDDTDGLNALMLCCRKGNIDMFQFLIVTWRDSDPIFDKGMTCLMVAVMHQQRQLAKYIAAVLPDQLHLRNDDGWDSLLFCSKYGDIELFDFLIKQGMDPRTKPQGGLSCLMSAVRNGQLEITKHIVMFHPEELHQIDQNGWNVLHYCCQGGDITSFCYLVKKGLKLDIRTNNGSTSLIIAVGNKHFELTRHIMDKYPEQLEQRDNNGFDALLWCCQGGDVKLFDYLIAKGVKPDTRASNELTCLMITALNKHFDLARHIVEKYPEQLKQRDINSFDALLWCCLSGDIKLFDYLVEKGVKPDTRSFHGLTCLMIAALNKHIDLARHIVDKYPEQLKQRDNNSFDALLWCCHCGDVKLFDYLIEKGVKPDTRASNELTCLMIAALNKHIDLARHIVDKYPEQLKQRDNNSFDALLWCCHCGDVKLFDYLIEKGVKPDTRTSNELTCLMIAALNKHIDLARHIVDKYPEQLKQRDINSFDALLWCCSSGDAKLFDYLVEKGVKPDTRASNELTCLMIAALNKHFDLARHIVEKYPEQLKQRDINSFDALLWCCLSGDIKLFDFLVEKGAKPDTRASNGLTCLMIAALNKHFDLARHIVDKYPEQLEQRNNNGFDVLFWCCHGGDVKLFDYLIEKGVEPDTRAPTELTCLMIAAGNKHFDLARHIVEKYPEQLKQRDSYGNDALLWCCLSGDVKLFDYLIEKGVKPDTRAPNELTCLMIAALNKHFDLARHIVDKYPEQLEQRDINSLDVLLWCCYGGDVKLFDYLIETGVKPDTRASNGLTCLIIAARNKHFDLAGHIVDKYPEQLEQRDNSGFDVLLDCCEVGDVKLFDYLIEKGVKPDTRAPTELTCLMIAARNKHFDLARHIVEKYPEQLKQRDSDGNDALLWCCRGGDVKLFDYLVEKGVKPDTCSSNGLTCLPIAYMNRHIDLARHIKNKYPE